MKTRICFYILLTVLFAVPGNAGTKEELIRLQNEIMTLQKQFRDSNEIYNERLNGIYSMLTQLNDQIAKTNSTLTRFSVSLDSRTDDARNQDRSLQTEIRSLSEKIDDVSVRVSALAQQFSDYKTQSTMRPAGAASSLSATTMYDQAYRDFMMGDFEMAIEGFRAYVEAYPGGETAAKSLVNMGESYSQLSMLPQAIVTFTRVINEYPQTSPVPTALFKRAKIEAAIGERDNAIADYKDIIDRFPASVEIEQARVELRLLEATQKPKPSNTKTPTTPPRKTTGR